MREFPFRALEAEYPENFVNSVLPLPFPNPLKVYKIQASEVAQLKLTAIHEL